MISEKELAARDLAEQLVHEEDTDVTIETISKWSKYDIYEWLEIGWSFYWSEKEKTWKNHIGR